MSHANNVIRLQLSYASPSQPDAGRGTTVPTPPGARRAPCRAVLRPAPATGELYRSTTDAPAANTTPALLRTSFAADAHTTRCGGARVRQPPAYPAGVNAAGAVLTVSA